MDGISQWEFALSYYGLLSTTVDYIFDKFDIDQKGIDVVTRKRLITATSFRDFITKFLTAEVQQVKNTGAHCNMPSRNIICDNSTQGKST